MRYCGKCGEQNPDEGVFCWKCGERLFRETIGQEVIQRDTSSTRAEDTPHEVASEYSDARGRTTTEIVEVDDPGFCTGDSEIVSKLSALELATTKNITKGKCQRYRAPAIILSIISGLGFLVLLFCVDLQLTSGSGTMLELDWSATPYELINDMGAESRAFPGGLLNTLFWLTAIFGVIGIFMPVISILTTFFSTFLFMSFSNITINATVVDVIAETSVYTPLAIIVVYMMLSLVAFYCSTMYGVQFRSRRGKMCIQEFTPFM